LNIHQRNIYKQAINQKIYYEEIISSMEEKAPDALEMAA